MLIKFYPGISVPPLPEKQILGNSTDFFLENRRQALKKYLNVLAKHPILVSSEAFILFLQCKDDKFANESQKFEDKNNVYHFDFLNLEDTYDKIQTKVNYIFSQKIIPVSQELVNIDRELNYIEPTISELNNLFSG